ncbi:MAG: type II toxin-antitoxin system VapC family toxin [Candidatus Omnitrophota bacterium]|nr:MAG: type II toxin-antitoxin system VapC family toxin [Candidatus Omnitrophota bacterium]
MVLVDTSVWIDHLRYGNQNLIERLNRAAVICHPYVIGELACGNLKNRKEILDLLQALPLAPLAEPEEILHFIDAGRFYGRGLGWIDVNLLASSRLMGCHLWTLDTALASAAIDLDLNFELTHHD